MMKVREKRRRWRRILILSSMNHFLIYFHNSLPLSPNSTNFNGVSVSRDFPQRSLLPFPSPSGVFKDRAVSALALFDPSLHPTGAAPPEDSPVSFCSDSPVSYPGHIVQPPRRLPSELLFRLPSELSQRLFPEFPFTASDQCRDTPVDNQS